jgi:hypothetical protein
MVKYKKLRLPYSDFREFRSDTVCRYWDQACAAKSQSNPDLSPYLCAAVNILSVRHFVASLVNGSRVWMQREGCRLQWARCIVDMSSQICISTQLVLAALRRSDATPCRSGSTSVRAITITKRDLWGPSKDSEELFTSELPTSICVCVWRYNSTLLLCLYGFLTKIIMWTRFISVTQTSRREFGLQVYCQL